VTRARDSSLHHRVFRRTRVVIRAMTRVRVSSSHHRVSRRARVVTRAKDCPSHHRVYRRAPHLGLPRMFRARRSISHRLSIHPHLNRHRLLADSRSSRARRLLHFLISPRTFRQELRVNKKTSSALLRRPRKRKRRRVRACFSLTLGRLVCIFANWTLGCCASNCVSSHF
jgi:hypothetical protein